MDDIKPLAKPVGSDIVERASPTRASFEVPPPGVIRGNKFLFFFSCVWCVFILLFTGLFLIAKGGLLEMPLGQALGMVAFLSIFWLVGIGVMLFAVNLGRRRVTLEYADHQLSVAYTNGLFGNKVSVWPRAEVQCIEVGTCHTSEGDKPLKQLQIMRCDGKMTGLLTGRNEAELDWLVGRLNQYLRLAPRIVHDVLVADVEQPPPNCLVQLQTVESGFRLSVPPSGLWRGSLGIFPFGVAWSIWIPLAAICILLFFQVAESPQFALVCFMLAGNELVGIAIMLLGYYLGTRQAEIAVAADRLLVINQGIFANWRREWSRDELLAVRSVRSGSSSNNKPFMQLQIVPRQGAPVKLLTGRNDQELAWIATRIRHALNLPAIEPGGESKRSEES